MAKNSNGTVKVPSKLETLHQEWVAAGSKPISKRDGGELLKRYMAAKQARAQAEEAFLAAQRSESDCVAAIIRARGKGRIRIAGEVFVPMARGETVFLRREGGGEVSDLG